MHSFFEDIFNEVEKFESGAYCCASERHEIDTPYHTHNKGQFIYAEKGTLNIFTNTRHFFYQLNILYGYHKVLSTVYGQITPR